jgi:hypothetical protein
MSTDTCDSTQQSVASLLERLCLLVGDDLMLDSPDALQLKRELAGRGLPLVMTGRLIELARTVGRSGGKVSFIERGPGQIKITVSYDTGKASRKRWK